MSMRAGSGAALAEAAEALVGVPFRLHGRDPAHGLDCIGLLGAALTTIGRPAALPTGYPLRLASLQGWLPDATALGFGEAIGEVRPGDVALLSLGAAQVHLVIADRDRGHVHAHAGLRRVVRSPGLPAHPQLARWRLSETET